MGRAQVLFGFTSLKPLFAGNFLLGARGAVAHARSLFPDSPFDSETGPFLERGGLASGDTKNPALLRA